MAAVRLNQEMVAELQRAFSLQDNDQDGKIFSADIATVIRSVRGLKPSEVEVTEMVDEVQANGDMIDLQGLVALITRYVTEPDPDRPENLAEMFRMYDKEGKGLIPVRDLCHLLTNIGEKLSDREAEDLVKLSGCLERDMVNYNKFVKVVLGQ